MNKAQNCSFLKKYITSLLSHVIFFLTFIYLYLFLAVLGLHCCMQAFSSCSEWGILCCGSQPYNWGGLSCWGGQVLGAGLSSCSSWALEHTGFSSCGPLAKLLFGTWDLPISGLQPLLPALADRFLSTGPPREVPQCRSLRSFFSFVSVSFLKAVESQSSCDRVLDRCSPGRKKWEGLQGQKQKQVRKHHDLFV